MKMDVPAVQLFMRAIDDGRQRELGGIMVARATVGTISSSTRYIRSADSSCWTQWRERGRLNATFFHSGAADPIQGVTKTGVSYDATQ